MLALGGGLFLMSEVPLCTVHDACVVYVPGFCGIMLLVSAAFHLP